MYVVIHDDEDVIPENGLVTLVHHTYACADVCFKIIIGSGERGGIFTCSFSWIDYCSHLRLAFGFPGIGRIAGLLDSAAVGGNSTVNSRFA